MELLDKVVGDIVDTKRAGLRVFVNVAPGFKAESSSLVLASIPAGADGVVYTHETFREPVFIPAVPIKIVEEFAGLVKALMPDGRAPRDVWGYLDPSVRKALEERGIVKCREKHCEIKARIKLLIGRSIHWLS